MTTQVANSMTENADIVRETGVKVWKTTNYKMFHFIPTNRTPKEAKIRKLVRSIQKKNMLSERPIMVNKDKGVVDRQTRLLSAERLKLPIYFTVNAEARMVEVHLLNANTWPWTMQDYLESYMKDGRTEYLVLDSFTKKYGLSLSVSLGLLTQEQNRVKDSISAFKEGEIKLGNLEKADKLGQNIRALSTYVTGTAWKSRDFIRALLAFYKKVDPDTFLEKVKDSPIRIGRRATIKEYLRDFSDVYNFRMRTNRVSFDK